MSITDVLTIKEATEIYKIKIDRIRLFLNRGAKGLVENVDYRKSGSTWLITREALEKTFNVEVIKDDELFI